MNKVAKNNAREMAASALNAASIVVSTTVVVKVDVRRRGGCIEIAVDVVMIISVMIE
jgi:hypothetical protein